MAVISAVNRRSGKWCYAGTYLPAYYALRRSLAVASKTHENRDCQAHAVRVSEEGRYVLCEGWFGSLFGGGSTVSEAISGGSSEERASSERHRGDHPSPMRDVCLTEGGKLSVSSQHRGRVSAYYRRVRLTVP